MHMPTLITALIIGITSATITAQEAPHVEAQAEITSEQQTVPEQPTPLSTTIIPAEPEPVKDEPIIIPEQKTELDEPMGIDTVSLDNPQGNWLFKKIWWERAEERYDKIRQLVDALWTSRTDFFIKRSKLDRDIIDPFYLNVGVGQGELQTILTELIEFFEKHREQEGDLNEQERMLYESLVSEEESLKQLRVDVEAIMQLDRAIDEALGTLMNQINRVRNFEAQAWDNFKEIAHILNDTRARELYYMIEGAARNIKNISNYLERNFTSHFDRLIGDTTKHIARIQNQIEGLKEKGINFKKQTELTEQQKHAAAQDEENETEQESTPKPALSWFGWIMSMVTNAFNTLLSIIQIPYDMIFGK
jgi:hypothetical protein